METTKPSAQKSAYRLTVILPLILSAVVYGYIATSCKDVFAGWSERQFLAVLTVVNVAQFLYFAALFPLFVGALESAAGRFRRTLQTILVLAPIIVGSFIGAVASTSGAEPGPFQSLLVYTLLVVSPFIFSVIVFVPLAVVFRLFIYNPVAWLLGNPEHEASGVKQPLDQQQSGAASDRKSVV